MSWGKFSKSRDVKKWISKYESQFKKEKEKEKMFIKIEKIWYYNVYIHQIKLLINYSD